MEMTKQERLEKLLNAYSYHYNIFHDVAVEGGSFPAAAFFFLRDENYLLSRRHVLSAVENYEYVYFYITDNLTASEIQGQIDLSLNAGMSNIKPNKEHMSSFVTLVVIADTIEPDAKTKIKKMRMHKNLDWHSTAGWSII